MPLEPGSQGEPSAKLRGLSPASEAAHAGLNTTRPRADLASSDASSHCQANAWAKTSV